MSRPYTRRTAADVAQAVSFFDGLTERDLRRRQDLCAVQLRMAWDLRDHDTAKRLQDMESDLTAALLRRC